MAELSTKQHRAIAALLARGTVTGAAREADTSERQLYRWLNEPEFKAELERQQSELSAAGYRLLVSGVASAVAVIRALMTDTSVSPGIRLRAADNLLSHQIRWAEHGELVTRLEEIEAAIATSMLVAAVAENSDPVQPARRVIDYRLKLKPPPGYIDGDNTQE